jgi:Uma2 family endonuclease
LVSVSGLIFEDMVAEQRQFITQEAYLAMEREAFEKSEYYEGQLYPMAGATKEHNRIKENLSIEIGYFLKGKPCQSFSSDYRVHIPKNG